MSHGTESNRTRDSLPDEVQDKSRHTGNQVTERPSPFGSTADETTRLRESR
ncbi:hypothetical protein PFICI_14329 [Pestalotiopsis fici W106-1]|uniref:Uncharacterized protein n=1 Tax=Pestalotiopsis fici (strain W106-1 / CGMCC3.15140) TaxID=1229662 RepID=W3WKQ1_PESFW|nr:uncharacterized protein PFICI_14329 [Pestalotiopsis fici W106-1]ETS74463.1 hypothetical protein PFICI_14329 [Pestalotiopsis fici W106-1]